MEIRSIFGRRRDERRAEPEPEALDLEPVIARIQREEGIDRETAELWFSELLVFLGLCARDEEILAPPEPVDRAWHAFILHTRLYQEHCEREYGRLVHHEPAPGPDLAAYERAWWRRRWDRSVRSLDASIWPTPPAVLEWMRAEAQKRGDVGRAEMADGDVFEIPLDLGGGASCGGASCGGGGGN